MTRLTPSADIHPNQTFYRTRMPCFATSKTDAILHRKFRTFIEQLGGHTSEVRLPHTGIWALQRPRPSSPDSGPYSKRGFNSDSAIQRHVHSHRIDSLCPLINVPCFNVPHGRAAGHARPIVDENTHRFGPGKCGCNPQTQQRPGVARRASVPGMFLFRCQCKGREGKTCVFGGLA